MNGLSFSGCVALKVWQGFGDRDAKPVALWVKRYWFLSLGPMNGFEASPSFRLSCASARQSGVIHVHLEKLLSTVEAADRLGVSASYLNKLRVVGGGPPFVKIGARVAYDQSDLGAWLATQKRTTTADAPVAQAGAAG